MIIPILYCCNFGLSEELFIKKINKKYAEVMHQADNAAGRKRSI